jgi:hypothetical protein
MNTENRLRTCLSLTRPGAKASNRTEFARVAAGFPLYFYLQNFIPTPKFAKQILTLPQGGGIKDP